YGTQLQMSPRKKRAIERHVRCPGQMDPPERRSLADPPNTVADEKLRNYSITSVAATNKELGKVSPSAFAVLLLRKNSIFAGSSTGMSAGLAPFRILSTKAAARRHIAGWSAP